MEGASEELRLSGSFPTKRNNIVSRHGVLTNFSESFTLVSANKDVALLSYGEIEKTFLERYHRLN